MITVPQFERLTDGQPPEPVIVVKGAAEGLTSCAPGRHCAAHGSGPVYPCCKCGATFRRKVLGR